MWRGHDWHVAMSASAAPHVLMVLTTNAYKNLCILCYNSHGVRARLPRPPPATAGAGMRGLHRMVRLQRWEGLHAEGHAMD